MGVIFDLIVIGIIALFTFLGYKQGLVNAAIKIFSFLIAIVIAFAIYKPVSNLIIKNTSIDDNIKNGIIERIGLGENEEVKIEDSFSSKMLGKANSTVVEVADTFAVKLIETSVLLLLFIIIKIGLKFVSALTDLITKLPVLKQINKLRTEPYME